MLTMTLRADLSPSYAASTFVMFALFTIQNHSCLMLYHPTYSMSSCSRGC